MLRQQFDYSATDPDRAHAMYRDDAMIEFPQSGERFEGVESFREWRSKYPASTSFEIREVRGQGEIWVAELSIAYDDGPVNFGVSILELRGDRIARVDLCRGGLGATGVARAVEGSAVTLSASAPIRHCKTGPRDPHDAQLRGSRATPHPVREPLARGVRRFPKPQRSHRARPGELTRRAAAAPRLGRGASRRLAACCSDQLE